jgi:hypothetical protein
LVAVSVDLAASLTDQAVDLFDRLVGALFRKAEGRHARAFQADARAINDKVRLFARVGAALITGRNNQQDGYEAIIALMPWESFARVSPKRQSWRDRRNLTLTRTSTSTTA